MPELQQQDEVAPRDTRRVPPALLSPIRVLFVDDELSILRSISRSLAEAPLEVIIAHGPAEALQMLDQHPVDVMVSDIDMPEMNGLELAQIARRDHPDTIRILLTGAATLDKALHAINEGEVLRFLQKPFEPVVFLEEIETLEERIRTLRSRKAESERQAYRRELTEWLDRRFPGTTQVTRNDLGEVVLDLLPLLGEIDELHLPNIVKDLLRKEG